MDREKAREYSKDDKDFSGWLEGELNDVCGLIRDLLDEAHVVWPQHCHGCSDHTDNPRLCPHQVCDQARQWLKKHG